MRDSFRLYVPGKPVPWGRATPVIVGDFPVMKTPAETRAYQKAVKQLAKLVMGGRPLMTGPLRMTVTAILARPKTVTRALPWKQGTGDVDNYAKSVKDAFNGLVYIDDSQICTLIAGKEYGAPALTVVVERIEEPAEAAKEKAA